MGRILALDWGEKRIGLAISDLNQLITQTPEPPVSNNAGTLSYLKKLIKKYDIEHIVVGLPKSLAGRQGTAAKKVTLFAEKLTARTGLPIEFLDERFTTVRAKELLQDANLRKSDYSRFLDNAAAQILLQQHLDRKHTSFSNG